MPIRSKINQFASTELWNAVLTQTFNDYILEVAFYIDGGLAKSNFASTLRADGGNALSQYDESIILDGGDAPWW